MSLSLSTTARNVRCDALVDLADAGSGAGRIRIYTGSKPATPDTSATGTLLAEFTLNDPAFGSAALGSASLDVDPELTATGLSTGTAGWFRLLDSTEAGATGLGIMDGTVTADGAGGDLTLSTVSIVEGGDIEIVAGTVTEPSSG